VTSQKSKLRKYTKGKKIGILTTYYFILLFLAKCVYKEILQNKETYFCITRTHITRCAWNVSLTERVCDLKDWDGRSGTVKARK